MVMWVRSAAAAPLLHGVCALDWALTETHPPPRLPPAALLPEQPPGVRHRHRALPGPGGPALRLCAHEREATRAAQGRP
jgi:hypothetical protein